MHTQKQSYSQKAASYAHVEAQALTNKKIENVRPCDFKVQQLVEQGWCNEVAAFINNKCNEIFTRILPKKLENFAHKQQIKDTSTVIETSIPFHTLVKLVDAEDLTNEKIRPLDPPLKINNVTSKLDSQNLSDEFCDLNPESKITQTPDPNNRSKQ